MVDDSSSTYNPPQCATLRDILHNDESPAIIDVQSVAPLKVMTLSHATLRARVARYASTLSTSAPAGATVALVMPNCTALVVAFLSAGCAGLTAAPLNPAYTADEFEFYLSDSGARLVVLTESMAGADAPIVAACKSLGIEHTIVPDDLSAPGEESGDFDLPADFTPTPDTRCLFLHTSGTTSRPKGVPLSHGNLCTSIANISATYHLKSDDRTLLVMPLFHVHGLMAATLSTLATRGALALPPGGKFSASAFWPAASAARITWYTAVPTIHQILLARADADYAAGDTRLRFIRSCSASLAPAVLERVEKAFGAPVLEAYAMTEAAHQMTSNPLPVFGPRKPGSVGVAQNVSLEIYDAAGGQLFKGRGDGCVGEVCISGRNVTVGYNNNEKANSECFFEEDGVRWFRTGDQGWLDSEGYLKLTGRIKELINRGGEKISPVEVDAAMLAHKHVKEAVAFAAPDDKYGEEVNAAVILKQAVEQKELEDFLGSRLASFKVPKRFFFCEDLPRTATGKIQRRIVAKHFLEQS